MDIVEFIQMQRLPYEEKIDHARLMAEDFYLRLQGNVFCSVGGLDSITLLYFLRKHISNDIPGVSVSTLEDKSIQAVHHQIDNMVILKPEKSKVQVINEFGYPVISKATADKIEQLQNPNDRNATIRHAIITGDTGEQGGYRNSRFMRLPDKWQRLFVHQEAPFKVSGKCCYYMKEKPCDRYSRETGRYVYMALMADEGGRREISLKKHGCNYYGKTVIRSCPFAIFNKTDLLRLAIELNVPIPAIYGEVIELSDGDLTTTKAKRTGCTMCGFGVHIEKRPNRFDRLRETDYKQWLFWMYEQGWGRVLSYIGVEWENYQPSMI